MARRSARHKANFRRGKAGFRRRNSRFRSRFSRKHGRNSMTSMRSRSLVAPDTAFTKLRFQYNAFLAGPNLPHPTGTLTTDFTNFRLLRGNDIYDPQSNNGNTSATGFSQWCSQTGLYQEFLVHASKVKVELVNLTPVGSTPGALNVALYPIMENNATVTTMDGNEQAYARTAFIGDSSGSSKVILKNFMKTKKMIGVKDLEDDEQNRGSYNSSPVSLNLWDWALDVTSVDDSTASTTRAIGLKTVITYYVQFLQRPVVSLSTHS